MLLFSHNRLTNNATALLIGPTRKDLMLLVTGSILAKTDRLDDLLASSLEHVARSRAEPGCLEHGVYRDAEDPLRLLFVERWSDAQALAAHFALPASRDFVRSISELAATPPELKIYDARPTQI